MPDNVTLTVGFDLAKFEADTRLLVAKAKKLGTDLNAAAKQAVTSGDRGPLDALSKAYTELSRKAHEYTVSLREQKKAQDEATSSAKRLASEQGFAGITKSLKEIEESFTTIRRTVWAEAIFKGLELIKGEIERVLTRFDQLKRLSAASGFPTEAIQVFQEAVKRTGADAEIATRVIYGLSRAMAEARLQAQRTGSLSITPLGGAGVNIIRGTGLTEEQRRQQRLMEWAPGGAAVLRPHRPGEVGPPEIKSQQDALIALGIQSEKYNSTLQSRLKLLEDIAGATQAMVRGGKEDYASEITQQLFGKQAREITEAFRDIKPGSLTGLYEEMRRTGQIIEPQGKERLNQLEEILNKFVGQMEGRETRAGIAAAPGATAAVQAAVQTTDELTSVPRKMIDAMIEMGNSAVKGSEVVTKNLTDAGTIIAAGINNLWEQVRRALPSATDPNYVPGQGFAEGGAVHGPGTGTSDSILARLSNGEYVMRAGAVRNLGVGFFDALNHYAAGGLVGFAAGGSVAAAAGTPVNVHIGTSVFPMHASNDVAGALVVAARRHQMQSNGTKPSWYGR